MRGSDLVGGDVIAEFGIGGGIFCVPGQVFAGKLGPMTVGILGKKEDAAVETQMIGALFHLAIEERVGG